LSPQGQLQEVFLDAGLEGLLEFGLDLEEAIGGAQAPDPLVRPAMVVVPGPQPQPLLRFLEGIELSPDQKLLPHRGPEPLDLAEGHRMLRG